MNFCYFILNLILFTIKSDFVSSENRLYELNIKYIFGFPDGVHKSKVLSCNDVFPCPTLYADVGDKLTVIVHNNIQDQQNTTIHWHGIHMKNNREIFEDGTNYVTQCPLKFGHSQKYSFQLDLPGTYWYHSHTESQYSEGLWGVLIVRNTPEVYEDKYDDEIIITLSDWYHQTAKENEHWHLATYSRGVPPYPNSALLNGLGRYNCTVMKERGDYFYCNGSDQFRHIYTVKKNKKIRFRVINTASYAAFRFSIDDHELETIEVDGVDTVPVITDEAILGVGQRYSFIVSMNNSECSDCRFLIRADLMQEELILMKNENINPYTDALIPNVTAVLEYDQTDVSTDSAIIRHSTQEYTWNATEELPKTPPTKPLNESKLSPYDKIPAETEVDKEFVLFLTFSEDSEGIRRGSFNFTPYKFNDVPLIMDFYHGKPIPQEAFPLYVRYMEVVQIVINSGQINDLDFFGPHPLHIHGHSMYVLWNGKKDDGNYDPVKHKLNINGPRRDTVFLHQNSSVVIRFLANNPGVWTFHCHIDWHNLSGMGFVIVTGMESFNYKNSTVPEEAARICGLHDSSKPNEQLVLDEEQGIKGLLISILIFVILIFLWKVLETIFRK